jgi:hypothetical protein
MYCLLAGTVLPALKVFAVFTRMPLLRLKVYPNILMTTGNAVHGAWGLMLYQQALRCCLAAAPGSHLLPLFPLDMATCARQPLFLTRRYRFLFINVRISR